MIEALHQFILLLIAVINLFHAIAQLPFDEPELSRLINFVLELVRGY